MFFFMRSIGERIVIGCSFHSQRHSTELVINSVTIRGKNETKNLFKFN